MKRMNDFLDRITLGQIAAMTSVSWLVDWIMANEIITLLSFFTLLLSAALAIRKVLIYIKKDGLYGMEIIIKWMKNKKYNNDEEL